MYNMFYILNTPLTMGKLQKRIKIPPKNSPPLGYDKIQPVMKKFQNKLKILEERENNIAIPKNQLYWEIYRVDHQKSRYIYSLYYQRNLISEELYLWLVKHRFANGELIAKWRKQGYETLCCLQCIGKTVCVCRVPKNSRNKDSDFRCVSCGCKGCASTD